MPLIDSQIKEIEKCIGEKTIHLQSITGGDISDAFLLRTDKRAYFLKVNQSQHAKALLSMEVEGLQLLSNHCLTPNVFQQDEFQNSNGAFLILQYIPTGNKNKSFWTSFGQDLANLHHVTAPLFGLDHDNFIGKLPQSNAFQSDWASFYSTERLAPQVKMAFDNNLLPKSLLPSFDQLYAKLNDLCPQEKPSLIHGDLWPGNFMVNEKQQAIFIDPSVCYSHREMDLAMSLLFGGFDGEFYESYNRTFPLEGNFEERVPLYQLYYLLVHLNMFGHSYLAAVKDALAKY